MTAATDPLVHIWWLASRASGLLALALITFSVVLGLMMGGKVLRPGPGAAPRRIWTPKVVLRTHELTSLAAVIAIAVHGLTLLGDAYLRPSVADLFVPFALGYDRFWTGLGVIGGYVTAILGLSFYLRKWIGNARWKRMHRFMLVAYFLSVAHTLGSGTDAHTLWLQVPMAGSLAYVLLLFATRVIAARAPAQTRAKPVAQHAPKGTMHSPNAGPSPSRA